MPCPTRVTYCPLCRLPLPPAEIAACPADEYPTHYACRLALQEAEEQMDAAERSDDE